MADGDQTILPTQDGKMISKAVVKKPGALVPENILKDVEIGGVTGELDPPDPVDTEISLDFSAGSMEVTPGAGTLFNKVNIPVPVNLVPENIVKGVTIAGIEGESEGGSGDIEVDISKKPIRFYDPYGNVIYGYSRAEIQELTALPAGPALKGVTFEKWTHTLDELKAVTYYADVGPMYKYGSNPATILIVETIVASEVIKLTLSMTTSSYKATVYWGDGSSSTISGTTASSGANTTHTYTSAGVYIIAIVASNNFKLGATGSSYIHPPIGAGSVPTYTTSYSYFVGNCSANLKSILTASNGLMSGYFYAEVHDAALCTGLKFISVPSQLEMSYMSKQFFQCTALKTINGKFKYGSAYQFCFATNLKRVEINGSVAADTFIGCDSLIEVMFGNGAITDANMNSKWAMLMTTETPPSISATSPQWGTKPIYVPDSAVDAYKTASGWSNAAAYILPASQYPD